MALSGGANPNRQMDKVRKARPQLLVGTPGRVADLAYEWGKLKLQRVRHLVVDEVDESFRPPYLQPTRRLLDSFGDGRPLQLLFASATSDAPAVRRAASQRMRDPIMIRLAPPAGNPNRARTVTLTLASTLTLALTLALALALTRACRPPSTSSSRCARPWCHGYP